MSGARLRNRTAVRVPGSSMSGCTRSRYECACFLFTCMERLAKVGKNMYVQTRTHARTRTQQENHAQTNEERRAKAARYLAKMNLILTQRFKKTIRG